jgi:IclR family transcriptional regulator, acetate operon repressor
VLSELRAEELSRYLALARFEPVTPHTVRSKTRLKQEIQKVKASGFAYSREEFTLGITAIAIAVRSESKFHGAINLAVPTARFTADRDAEFRAAIQRTARIVAKEISSEL